MLALCFGFFDRSICLKLLVYKRLIDRLWVDPRLIPNSSAFIQDIESSR